MDGVVSDTLPLHATTSIAAHVRPATPTRKNHRDRTLLRLMRCIGYSRPAASLPTACKLWIRLAAGRALPSDRSATLSRLVAEGSEIVVAIATVLRVLSRGRRQRGKNAAAGAGGGAVASG